MSMFKSLTRNSVAEAFIIEGAEHPTRNCQNLSFERSIKLQPLILPGQEHCIIGPAFTKTLLKFTLKLITRCTNLTPLLCRFRTHEPPPDLLWIAERLERMKGPILFLPL